MPSLPLVDLEAQGAAFDGTLEDACLAVLRRADFILGADVAAFEREFAAYCGVDHAVGVDSGMSALELALRAMGVGPGDEVIAPANTFVGTTFPIAAAGARPVLVDVDPETSTLDPAQLAAAITRRTRAVVPVHLYGQCADMSAILRIAREHGLLVLEDACQAHGARWGDRRAGSLGDAAAFSFYPSKNLGASGDGGMVVTRDLALAERVRLLRNYGQREKGRSEVLAFNRRLDTLQAAILRVKLPRLDAWNAARRAHAAAYDGVLADLPLVRPRAGAGREHVWHLYVVRVPRRDAVRAALAEAGIGTGVHYPVPIHLQPAHRDLGYSQGDFPVAEQLAGEILSLPMYPEMPADGVIAVATALRGVLQEPSGGRARNAPRDIAGT